MGRFTDTDEPDASAWIVQARNLHRGLRVASPASSSASRRAGRRDRADRVQPGRAELLAQRAAPV